MVPYTYHHRYFSLKDAPFSIAVNPEYMFMSAGHRDALAHLFYGVAIGSGLILLTGEVGTGKATISRVLVQQLPGKTDAAVIGNPAQHADELLTTVCDEFGIDIDGDDCTLESLTDKLVAFLLDNHRQGRNTVLLIDEAQNLKFDALEQIHLLSRLETDNRKLLQIILLGKPELCDMLESPELRQLNQRIAVRCELRPLARDETSAYIHHRLRVAGLPATRKLFPEKVSHKIHRLTKGIPRLINVLCDHALSVSYGRNRPRVDMKSLRQAAAEVFASGQEEAKSRAGPVGLVASLLAASLAAGGLYWQRSATSTRAPAPVMAEQALAKLNSTRLRSTSLAEAKPRVIAAARRVEVAPPVETIQASGEQDFEVAPPVEVQARLEEVVELAAPEYYKARWMALRRLSEYLGGQRLGDCRALAEDGQICTVVQATTLEELFSNNQPAVLSLITRDGVPGYALLVGISAGQPILDFEGEEAPLPLHELSAMWQGEFMYLWSQPAGYAKPLRPEYSLAISSAPEDSNLKR